MRAFVRAVLALIIIFPLSALAWAGSSLPPYSPPAALAGNNLVNFFNPSLSTNGHKKIMVVGNSTVWNATGYFAELCNLIATPQPGAGNVLANVGLTPCTTSIASYTVNNTTGSITVNFSGSAPSGYTVGDLVLSQPSAPTLNTLIGTGVVTSIGAGSITYQLLAINPFPSTIGTTTSGGYITNSLANLGYNGATSVAINSTVTPLLHTYADAGDLVLTRGPLINDVRQGACNLACATANVVALYNAIASAVPAKTDIAWKTENSLLTTDPTSSGYVSPLASSAAYTKILQNAVFEAFAALPARAVVWDNMQIVYTKLGGEYATSAWMTDILHPDATGQTREADADAQILSQIDGGNGVNLAALNNPRAVTATNGIALGGYANGDLKQIAALQAQVGFSEFMTEHAMVDDYAAPWTLYPDSVLDLSRYDLLAYGSLNAAGSNYIYFTAPTVSGSTLATYEPGDLVWLEGSGVFQLPSTFNQIPYNNGATVYNTTLSSLGNIVPSSAYAGQNVVVVRQRSYIINDVPRYQNPATWTYRHRINVPAAGTNYIRAQITDTPGLAWPYALTTSDVLDLPCGDIPLTSASFSAFNGYAQINLTGSWGSCQSEVGWLFGTHAMESVGALVTSLSTVGTACYAIASLPAGAQGMRACVNNQTTSCPSPGGSFTAGGSVVCPAFYNGSAWVGD